MDSLDQDSVDVTLAVQFLDKATREVQSEGWKFNTESKYVMAPNNAGEIVIPDNVVSVKLDKLRYPKSNYDVTIRGSRLYNLAQSSYTFIVPLCGQAILLMDWDGMPEHVRNYVMLKARREFQADRQSSDSSTREQSQDELQALIKLKRVEGWESDITFIDSFLGRCG